MSDSDGYPSGLDNAVEEEAGPPTPGLATRVLDVFFNPGKLAEALAAKPVWAGALLVGALLIVVQTSLIPVEVWEAMFREAALQRSQPMPEGFAMGGTFMRLSAVVGGAIGWFVFAFLMAGITTLVFAFILGDEGRYRQYLSVLAHAWLIPALVGLAMVPLRISESNPQLTLNLGSFFFFLPDGYLLKVFTMLDLSQLWAWLVVAQGASVIDPRRSFTSAAIILFGFSLAMAMIFAPFVPSM